VSIRGCRRFPSTVAELRADKTRHNVATSTMNCSSGFARSEGEMNPRISVNSSAFADRKAIETSFMLSNSFWYALLLFSRSFSSSAKSRYQRAFRVKADVFMCFP